MFSGLNLLLTDVINLINPPDVNELMNTAKTETGDAQAKACHELWVMAYAEEN